MYHLIYFKSIFTIQKNNRKQHIFLLFCVLAHEYLGIRLLEDLSTKPSIESQRSSTYNLIIFTINFGHLRTSVEELSKSLPFLCVLDQEYFGDRIFRQVIFKTFTEISIRSWETNKQCLMYRGLTVLSMCFALKLCVFTMFLQQF